MKGHKTLFVRMLLGALLIMAFFAFTFFVQEKETPEPGGAVPPEVLADIPVPVRTDYGKKVPSDFLSSIRVPERVVLTQSYILEYPDQKQLTITFPSTKSMKHNYNLYKDFLKEDQWVTTNAYESEHVSSLYGTKGNNDMNITITASETEPTTSSNVSISVLKK